MTEVVNVALCGFGRAGKIHYGNLIRDPGVIVSYIVDELVEGVRERISADRQTHTTVCSPQEVHKVLEDKAVKAIIIATPTFTHEEYIKLGLRAGKAVFVEKPVAEEDSKAEEVYRLAAEKNLPLFCSFNRRYDPALQQLYRRIREGCVGKVYTVKTTSRDNPLPPLAYLKISGGLFHDMCIHDLDLVCWLVGEFPASVYATATAHLPEIREMNDVDTAMMTLKFPSGVMASIEVGRTAPYGYDQRVEVYGAEGVVESRNQPSSAVCQWGGAGITADVYKHSFPERYSESYVTSMRHFLDVVRGTASDHISGREVLTVNKLATLCEQSCEQGTAVPIPPDLLAEPHPHARNTAA